MIYTVKRIDEDVDFGCEERSEDVPVMAVVTLTNSLGEELVIKAEDAMLYECNINEGDKGFSSVYDRVKQEIQADPMRYREELQAIQNLIRQCVDLGMQIEAVEERNRASMEQVFATKFQGVRQVKQSKTVANKYYKSMANGMVNDSLLYDQKK